MSIFFDFLVTTMECDPQINLADLLEQAITNFATELRFKVELLQRLHLFPGKPEFSRRHLQPTPDDFSETLSAPYSEPLPVLLPLQDLQQPRAEHSESEAADDMSILLLLSKPLQVFYVILSYSVFFVQIHDQLRQPPKQRLHDRRQTKLRPRTRIRVLAKASRRLPLGEFLGSFKPQAVHHDESGSDLHDLERYPPLPREANVFLTNKNLNPLNRPHSGKRHVHDTSQQLHVSSPRDSTSDDQAASTVSTACRPMSTNEIDALPKTAALSIVHS